MINIKGIKTEKNGKPVYFDFFQHIDGCYMMHASRDNLQWNIEVIGQQKDFTTDFKTQEDASKFCRDLMQLIVKQEKGVYLEINIADYGYN